MSMSYKDGSIERRGVAKEAHQRISELESQVALLKMHPQDQLVKIMALENQVAELKTTRQRLYDETVELKQVLGKYGRHLENCLGGISGHGKHKCTCGLEEALKEKE